MVLQVLKYFLEQEPEEVFPPVLVSREARLKTRHHHRRALTKSLWFHCQSGIAQNDYFSLSGGQGAYLKLLYLEGR